MINIRINTLKVKNGDSFLISSDDYRTNILVDGGPRSAKNEVESMINNLIKRQLSLDYICVTHVDNDHICGIIELLKVFIKKPIMIKKLKLKGIFYNNFDENENIKINNCEISFKNGNELSKLIKEVNIKLVEMEYKEIKIIKLKANDSFICGSLELNILTPLENEINILKETWEKKNRNISIYRENYGIDIEDIIFKADKKYTVINSSSISFLISDRKSIALFSGDASPVSMTKSLLELGYNSGNKLKLDLLKLAHHGAKNSITEEFLEIIECSKYLISTNGCRFNHPSKETLAKIILHFERKKLNFYFNYERRIFTENDLKNYDIEEFIINKEINI